MPDQLQARSVKSIEVIVTDDLTASRFAIGKWQSYRDALAIPNMRRPMEVEEQPDPDQSHMTWRIPKCLAVSLLQGNIGRCSKKPSIRNSD